MTAEEVAAIRLKLGITQAQLAKLTGADVRTVQNWEKRGTDSRSFVKKLHEISTKERIEMDSELKRPEARLSDQMSRFESPCSYSDLLEALRAAQEQNSRSQEHLRVALEQNSKSQEQIDRLLVIIEQLMPM